MTLPNDLTTFSQGELILIIYEQRDTIAALESQIAELRSRLDHQGPPKEKNPPSWVKPNVKPTKHGPKKKRLQGFARKLDTPTKQVFHTYNSCPDCGGDLGQPAVSYTRQTIDLPPSKAEVTEHVIFRRWCSTCNKRVAPKVTIRDVVVGQQRIGIRLMSIIDMLKEVCRQPLATIQSYLEIVHHLHLSEGAMVRLLHRTATLGKPSYDGLKRQVRSADVVFADETGGRENGSNGYYWNFSTKTVQFLLYKKTRSNTVITDVLGSEDEKDAFTGVLSSDFYTAYNIYNGFHQRCWVHLNGDMNDLKELYPGDKEVDKWVKDVHTIYQQAKVYPGPDPNLPSGVKEQQRIEQQAKFEAKLRAVCAPYVKTDKPMSILCSRMIKHLQELFVFIRFEAVPSDNNHAERILRHTVIARKISGGTRSAKGSETKSILASLFGTWRLQGLNPLTQCQLLLASAAEI